ncbi:nuclear autoantigen Sp-100 isoform X5 [Physeter macrocephalus]|uniref:Nuclear autoantigen Sp-100 isoform X5 n=1 Tax=Physeter macrocephalus TaxID=9755 RepID=A0A9W2X4N0_PHYMC|nr:nuclear autoantigen Sp-100 isoform X5 [Physeter catodon]
MAGGGSVLSSRLATENQNTDDTLIFETVFRHFKRHKVEISTAIKKTFPFLEGLRDRELITNRMYEDCQDSCRNLVPVSRVVYNVLNELEKTFDMSLLDALFSEVNRQEYPDLNHIYESFRKVIQEKIHHEESNGEEREERPTLPLSLEQGTWENSCQGRRESSSYDGTTSPENGLLDHLCETEEINAKRKDTTSDQNDALESQQANEQFAQESEPAEAKLPNHGLQINSCSVLLVDIKKEKPCFNPEVERQTQARTDCNQASDVIVISSEDSAESSDGDESPEPSTSAPRKASDPWDIDNTSICSISSRKRRISSGDTSELSNEDEPQETSSSVLRNGSDTTDIGSDSTLGKHSEKRRRKTVNTGPLKRGRKRGPRIPKETNMDFQLPELPVTCGEAKGILYKEKMNKGTSEKCIQNAYGKWFTLREFEIEGNHEASKNWKLSVRCCGWPLKTLIQRKFLPNPSRKRKKLGMSESECKSSGDVPGTAKKSQELKAQRKDRERQEEEEVTEEPKRFTMQEIARGFSLFEEALLVFEAQDPNVERYMNVAAAIQNVIRCYRVIYDEKNRATTQTSLDRFLKRVDRIESSKEPEPVPSASGVSEIAACPPSPIADDPSALPSPPSCPSSSQ